MAPNADPWRTLGLSPGSTQDEIRRAYRRLAKVNHPDAAGDAALPRFLAIQAAYEQLAGPGRIRRVGARPASRPTDSSSTDPREPWRADPNRARASGRADGRRTPGARPSAPGARPSAPGARARPPGSGPATGSAAPPGAGGGPRRRPAGAGGGAGDRPGSTGGPAAGADRSGRASTGRRRQKRATPGSTSYEGADQEPFEPGWSGATWYGASSGTYWTINPKEYADPRKHGPEYQARARRARDGSMIDDPAAAGAPEAPEPVGPPDADPPGPDDAASRARPEDAPGDDRPAANDTGGRFDEPPRPFAAGRARRQPGGRRHWPDGQPAMATSASAAADDSVGSATQSVRMPGDAGSGGPPTGGVRTWIEQPAADHAGFRGPLLRRPTSATGRLAMALLGWPPLGVFAGATIDQTTGCGTFAASCPELQSPGTWILQAAIVLLLLALPAVAAWSAHGAVAALVAGIPAAVVLSAAGGSNVREASGPLLLSVLAVAYLAGVAYAILVPRLRSSPA
jgi:curved DNA-binding protein CbpA